jgi:voltage-gated potassium channel
VDQRSLKWQHRFEWPMIVAALLVIPLIAIEESDLGQPWGAVGTVLNWTTWGAFLAELVVMLAVVPSKRSWLRQHPLDLVVVVLTPPFAPAAMQAGRVFRLLRLLRLVRVFDLRRMLSLEGIRYATLLVFLLVIAGGAAFASIEKDQGLTAWDGVWWAVSTVTTVGYGDVSPMTDAGRALAMGIMLIGIGFVALLTAFVAERFIRGAEEVEEREDQVLAELRQIRERLDRIESGASS